MAVTSSSVKPLAFALLGSALFLGASAAPSRATITFDGLPGDLGYVPDGYGGVDWDNFYYANPVDNGYTGTGYNVGTISSPNVAFNGFGAPASISSSTPFNLESAYFTDVFEDGDTVQITGYVNGISTYSTSFTIDSETPTFETFDWGGLSSVDFSDVQGSQFALDNLTLVPSTPEPSTPTIMLLGCILIGGLATSAARKRLQAASFFSTIAD